jgi:hypothetical protein
VLDAGVEAGKQKRARGAGVLFVSFYNFAKRITASNRLQML